MQVSFLMKENFVQAFFDMKKDVTELKKMFLEILQNPSLAGNAANYTKESLMNDFPILTAPKCKIM
jgi:UTP:GlnB (protein PII) uridylyltransferase